MSDWQHNTSIATVRRFVSPLGAGMQCLFILLLDACHKDSNPNGVVPRVEVTGRNPVGVVDSSLWVSQGSSFLATLGSMTQSLRDWASRLEVDLPQNRGELR